MLPYMLLLLSPWCFAMRDAAFAFALPWCRCRFSPFSIWYAIISLSFQLSLLSRFSYAFFAFRALRCFACCRQSFRSCWCCHIFSPYFFAFFADDITPCHYSLMPLLIWYISSFIIAAAIHIFIIMAFMPLRFLFCLFRLRFRYFSLLICYCWLQLPALSLLSPASFSFSLFLSFYYSLMTCIDSPVFLFLLYYAFSVFLFHYFFRHSARCFIFIALFRWCFLHWFRYDAGYFAFAILRHARLPLLRDADFWCFVTPDTPLPPCCWRFLRHDCFSMLAFDADADYAAAAFRWCRLRFDDDACCYGDMPPCFCPLMLLSFASSFLSRHYFFLSSLLLCFLFRLYFRHCYAVDYMKMLRCFAYAFMMTLFTLCDAFRDDLFTLDICRFALLFADIFHCCCFLCRCRFYAAYMLLSLLFMIYWWFLSLIFSLSYFVLFLFFHAADSFRCFHFAMLSCFRILIFSLFLFRYYAFLLRIFFDAAFRYFHFIIAIFHIYILSWYITLFRRHAYAFLIRHAFAMIVYDATLSSFLIFSSLRFLLELSLFFYVFSFAISPSPIVYDVDDYAALFDMPCFDVAFSSCRCFQICCRWFFAYTITLYLRHIDIFACFLTLSLSIRCFRCWYYAVDAFAIDSLSDDYAFAFGFFGWCCYCRFRHAAAICFRWYAFASLQRYILLRYLFSPPLYYFSSSYAIFAFHCQRCFSFRFLLFASIYYFSPLMLSPFCFRHAYFAFLICFTYAFGCCWYGDAFMLYLAEFFIDAAIFRLIFRFLLSLHFAHADADDYLHADMLIFAFFCWYWFSHLLLSLHAAFAVTFSLFDISLLTWFSSLRCGRFLWCRFSFIFDFFAFSFFLSFAICWCRYLLIDAAFFSCWCFWWPLFAIFSLILLLFSRWDHLCFSLIFRCCFSYAITLSLSLSSHAFAISRLCFR